MEDDGQDDENEQGKEPDVNHLVVGSLRGALGHGNFKVKHAVATFRETCGKNWAHFDFNIWSH